MSKPASRFIVIVRSPEAPGLDGVGPHIPGSPRPRNESKARLVVPATRRANQ